MACDESLNVFAILSQDSDFLIYQYPKTVHYLSAKNFDYRTLYADGKTLRTYEYDRSAYNFFHTVIDLAKIISGGIFLSFLGLAVVGRVLQFQ
jgi:hypothetical protein